MSNPQKAIARAPNRRHVNLAACGLLLAFACERESGGTPIDAGANSSAGTRVVLSQGDDLQRALDRAQPNDPIARRLWDERPGRHRHEPRHQLDRSRRRQQFRIWRQCRRKQTIAVRPDGLAPAPSSVRGAARRLAADQPRLVGLA